MLESFAAPAGEGGLKSSRPFAQAEPATGPLAEDSAPTTQEAEGGVTLRKLTAAEINRIRFLELRGMRLTPGDRPDRVTAKIGRDVVEEFLAEMEGRKDFIELMVGRTDAPYDLVRRDFRKLTPPQKLHLMAYYKGSLFADKVQILSDPEAFVEFRKNVMPIVLRGCATTGCHSDVSPANDRVFTLYNDPKRSAATTYANFVVLNDLTVGPFRLIDRAEPANSLLLTYMLPAKDVKLELRHPDLAPGRPTPELPKPVFKSRNAPTFKRIARWIASLKHPQEDYGVRLVPGAAGPATQPVLDDLPPQP